MYIHYDGFGCVGYMGFILREIETGKSNFLWKIFTVCEKQEIIDDCNWR